MLKNNRSHFKTITSVVSSSSQMFNHKTTCIKESLVALSRWSLKFLYLRWFWQILQLFLIKVKKNHKIVVFCFEYCSDLLEKKKFLTIEDCFFLQIWGLSLFGKGGGGYFYRLIIFRSEFGSWIFIKKFQTFVEVNYGIKWVNLTPCQAHWIVWKMPLAGAKDEHFSYIYSSHANEG